MVALTLEGSTPAPPEGANDRIEICDISKHENQIFGLPDRVGKGASKEVE